MSNKILKDKDGIVYKLQTTGNTMFVYIRTKNDKKFKHIATIENKIYEKSIFNTVFFEKAKTIGFPYYLLKALHDKGIVKKIKVETPDKTLTIDTEKAFKVGKFFNFKRKGYELQIHIPINEFEEEKNERD